jgi:YD repeat-containing protein
MTHFLPDGQISEVEYHYPDGSVYRVGNYYDDAGKLKESRSRSNNDAETRSLYYYDDSGRLIRVASIDESGLQKDSQIFRYDDAGRKTAQYFLSIDAGVGAMSFPAGLGDSDQTTESVWYDRNHRFLQRVTYIRDANEKLLREEMHLDDDAFASGEIARASTEERERLMAQLTKVLGADRVMATTSYRYDEGGRQIERRTQMANLGDIRTTYTYDDRGNAVDEVTVSGYREMQVDETGNEYFANESSETTSAHYDYQYDAHGNWIERITSSAAQNSSALQRSNIERRQISYYPNSESPRP